MSKEAQVNFNRFIIETDIGQGDLTLYSAGLPRFPGNFTRDVIISGMVASHPIMLHDQLLFNGQHLGRKKDSFSGEEPGKPHHQYPQTIWNGLSTQYNACDTGALYLLGFDSFKHLTGDNDLFASQQEHIEMTIDYALSHLKDDVFYEDPVFSDAEQYGLLATYWKDSHLPERPAGHPMYPVVYPLVQAQYIRAFRAASDLLKRDDLAEKAGDMVRALHRFFDWDLGSFVVASDRKGNVRAVSSDALHMLFYLEPGDLTQDMIDEIVRTSQLLETPVGYRTLEPDAVAHPQTEVEYYEGYHSDSVWLFEQAMIHIGARKFGLSDVMEISERIKGPLEGFSGELLDIADDGSIIPGGTTTEQLWSDAAKVYFSDPSLYNFHLA